MSQEHSELESSLTLLKRHHSLSYPEVVRFFSLLQFPSFCLVPYVTEPSCVFLFLFMRHLTNPN